MVRATLDVILAAGNFNHEVNALSFGKCEPLEHLRYCIEDAFKSVPPASCQLWPPSIGHSCVQHMQLAKPQDCSVSRLRGKAHYCY